MNETRRMNMCRRSDEAALTLKQLLLFTDFSASMQLRAAKTVNCSEDNMAPLKDKPGVGGKMEVKIWTDNCAGQYKCRQNFFSTAQIPTDFEYVESVSHSYGQKGQFKGVWDAAGKVVKGKIRALELDGVRFQDAITCYRKLPEHLSDENLEPWEKYLQENDPKILNKTPYKVTSRLFGYRNTTC
ncbi:MAG: hypothetical protein SGARI_007711 [Bacillariaceae sp.]